MSNNTKKLAKKATSRKLAIPDLKLNETLCGIVKTDPSEIMDVLLVIKKRLRKPNSQLIALSLLESLGKTCTLGLFQCIVKSGLLEDMLNLLKKKPEIPVRKKLLSLLYTWKVTFDKDRDLMPHYYKAYKDLIKMCPWKEVQRTQKASSSASADELAPLRLGTVYEQGAVEAVLCCSNLKEESSDVSRKISKFAVQCFLCKKWRLISSQREYERIRFEMGAQTFECIQIHASGCSASIEITRDASKIWVDDHVGIPLTPEGFSRVMSLRGDNSRCDVYYKSMAGGSAKGPFEMRKFFPELDGETADKYIKNNFSWQCPKVDSSMLCSGDQVSASE